VRVHRRSACAGRPRDRARPLRRRARRRRAARARTRGTRGRRARRHGFSRGDLVSATVRRSSAHCLACADGSPDSCLTGDYSERGITRLHGFARELVGEDPAQLVPIPRDPPAARRARRTAVRLRARIAARASDRRPSAVGACSARSSSERERSARSSPSCYRLDGVEVGDDGARAGKPLIEENRRRIRRPRGAATSAASTSSSSAPATRS